MNVIAANWAPSTFDQSAVTKIRCSGLLGLIEPLEVESCSHETFVVAVHVNGAGPPAETSMKRFPNGTNESSVMVGGGQL